MAATDELAILQLDVTSHIAALNCGKHIHGITIKQQANPKKNSSQTRTLATKNESVNLLQQAKNFELVAANFHEQVFF